LSDRSFGTSVASLDLGDKPFVCKTWYFQLRDRSSQLVSKRTMRCALFAITFLLAALPETIPAPPNIPNERGSIVVSSSQNPKRWTADWTMEPSQENGRAVVRFTETGRGQYSSFSQPIAWRVEAIWGTDGGLHPLRIEKNITDMSGRAIGSERKTFDPTKGAVRFERKNQGQGPASESKSMSVPRDTLAPEGIAGILSFLPFDRWRPQSMHLFTNEPKLYSVKIEMRGKERVKTPAGEFDCYKIELVPELGALNLLRSFLPKAYFWFAVAQPHFWVRYEGPENGPGTPHIVMELQTYQGK
jgi:hypothetical protein